MVKTIACVRVLLERLDARLAAEEQLMCGTEPECVALSREYLRSAALAEVCCANRDLARARLHVDACVFAVDRFESLRLSLVASRALRAVAVVQPVLPALGVCRS